MKSKLTKIEVYLEKMKQLLYIPSNGYFIWGKASSASLRRCMNQYKKHFSLTATSQDNHQVFNKLVLRSKTHKNVEFIKRFSSNLPKELILMDFEVWPRPKFFRLFRIAYYFYFVLKQMDDSFSFSDFNRCTVTALHVVTTLLSELRFSELEGLLTSECKKEIENNLKYWPRDLISLLAIKPENIKRSIPCDIVVFSDENEKIFVEVRVIHYVWLKYSSKLKKIEESNIIFSEEPLKDLNMENMNNLYMYGVFNSKYIREITKGVTDQWTINAVNFMYYTDFLISLKYS